MTSLQGLGLGLFLDGSRDAAHAVAAVGALPLGFKVKLGLARGKYLPGGLHAAPWPFWLKPFSLEISVVWHRVRFGCLVLCLLSRSQRLSLPSVCCRDPGNCLSLVPVWSGRIGFWKGFLVRDGRRWLSDTEEVLGVGTGQGGKSSGRCDHN